MPAKTFKLTNSDGTVQLVQADSAIYQATQIVFIIELAAPIATPQNPNPEPRSYPFLVVANSAFNRCIDITFEKFVTDELVH